MLDSCDFVIGGGEIGVGGQHGLGASCTLGVNIQSRENFNDIVTRKHQLPSAAGKILSSLVHT